MRVHTIIYSSSDTFSFLYSTLCKYDHDGTLVLSNITTSFYRRLLSLFPALNCTLTNIPPVPPDSDVKELCERRGLRTKVIPSPRS